jgi:hypothetical protein
MDMAAIMLTVLLAPLFAQSSSRFQDLATELAARIAGGLTPTAGLVTAGRPPQADRPR